MRTTTRAASPASRLALIVPFILMTLFVAAPPAQAAIDAPVVASPVEETYRTYCRAHHGPDSDVRQIELTAYGWVCEKQKSGELFAIDMHVVCQEANHRPDVIDWFDERQYGTSNPWGCVQLQPGGGLQSHVDVDKVCKSGGNPNAYAYLAGGGRHSVADWMCKDGNLDFHPVFQAVCGNIHHAVPWNWLVPRFNYWDPYSITCWR